ncbi:hypothetical protein N7452_006112 [Penicillium brevicompactum]|uniref:Zn(2)-C6 fungal-type domain-containing protein n=1 Tax=Penicillium brevicompactum TaxID=5074 RepID=A0A9W9QMA3_PENBR|nr:hypothetical protein N7452_006112 [Penicillium brevicompactum]
MEDKNSEKRPGCPFCATHFSHRSSLIRHLKNNCNKAQPHTIRRKSCHQCVADKTRCNLKRPTCSRCSLKSIACQYPQTEASEAQELEHSSFVSDKEHAGPSTPQQSLNLITQDTPTIDPNLFDSFFTGLGPWDLTQESSSLALRSPNCALSPDTFFLNENGDSSPPELISNIIVSSDHIELQQNTIPAALANHSMEFIFRVLRSWPRMLAEEFQTPPLFHPSQVGPNIKLPAPLANCVTLAKMWHGHCPGAEEIVRTTIMRELDSIVEQSEEKDEAILLAALQSVVMYTIILLSPTSGSKLQKSDHHIIFRKVELLVYQIVRTGLYLQEERTQTRPSWEAWIFVTSKRRAVLALYLLHWAYSVLHKVPCFDCRDLGFMPAPAAKALWQARTEQEWNTRYIHWLSRWNGQGYLQAEFGRIQPGVEMNARAEKWLEESDEFGFIMISIVNATEFDPPSLKTLSR